jgi:hypothetical protein
VAEDRGAFRSSMCEDAAQRGDRVFAPHRGCRTIASTLAGTTTSGGRDARAAQVLVSSTRAQRFVRQPPQAPTGRSRAGSDGRNGPRVDPRSVRTAPLTPSRNRRSPRRTSFRHPQVPTYSVGCSRHALRLRHLGSNLVDLIRIGRRYLGHVHEVSRGDRDFHESDRFRLFNE